MPVCEVVSELQQWKDRLELDVDTSQWNDLQARAAAAVAEAHVLSILIDDTLMEKARKSKLKAHVSKFTEQKASLGQDVSILIPPRIMQECMTIVLQ